MYHINIHVHWYFLSDLDWVSVRDWYLKFDIKIYMYMTVPFNQKLSRLTWYWYHFFRWMLGIQSTQKSQTTLKDWTLTRKSTKPLKRWRTSWTWTSWFLSSTPAATASKWWDRASQKRAFLVYRTCARTYCMYYLNNKIVQTKWWGISNMQYKFYIESFYEFNIFAHIMFIYGKLFMKMY